MSEPGKNRAIWRALTTVNAPLPLPIDAETLRSCLTGDVTDPHWRPHVRAFFREVAVEVLLDMLVEGSVTLDDLSSSLSFWKVDEDYDNARWTREMAAVPVAKADEPDAQSRGFRRA